MKKISSIIIILMLALCPSMVNAQDMLQYTSTACGISLPVPANCQEVQDNDEGTILQTPDELYSFSAIPMHESQYDESVLTTLANAAKIDLEHCSSYDINTDVLEGKVLGQDNPNGSVSCTGAVKIKGTEFVYAITFVAAADYTQTVAAALKTITVEPDAIK